MDINNQAAEEHHEQLLSLPADKIKRQRLQSLGQAKIKERNIVSVRAKRSQPQFVYNRAYVAIN